MYKGRLLQGGLLPPQTPYLNKGSLKEAKATSKQNTILYKEDELMKNNTIEQVQYEPLLQQLKLLNPTHNFIKNNPNENELQRFTAFKNQSGGYDCDVAILPTALYKQVMYPELDIEEYAKHKYELLGEVFYLRGDVMTSATVTVKTYARLFHADLLENGNVPQHLLIGKNNQANWAHFVANHIPYETLHEQFTKFIALNHTYGNFLPVPVTSEYNFNTARSNFGKYDFADLMLHAIYHWFNENPDELKKLLKHQEGILNLAEKWLSSFNSWQEFVDKHYLHAFVVNYEAGDLTVRYFFDQHSINKPLPTSQTEMLQLLTTANEVITKRCTDLYKALQSS